MISACFLLAGSEVGFAGFPCLGDLDEDAGDEPQERCLARERPTTRVRFLIWPLMFSQALDVRRRFLRSPEMPSQNFLREACEAANEE